MAYKKGHFIKLKRIWFCKSNKILWLTYDSSTVVLYSFLHTLILPLLIYIVKIKCITLISKLISKLGGEIGIWTLWQSKCSFISKHTNVPNDIGNIEAKCDKHLTVRYAWKLTCPISFRTWRWGKDCNGIYDVALKNDKIKIPKCSPDHGFWWEKQKKISVWAQIPDCCSLYDNSLLLIFRLLTEPACLSAWKRNTHFQNIIQV